MYGVKANNDTCLKIEGSWGLGSVIRDEDGNVMASATWINEG